MRLNLDDSAFDVAINAYPAFDLEKSTGFYLAQNVNPILASFERHTTLRIYLAAHGDTIA